MKSKNVASIDQELCAACGTCLKVCPRSAVSIIKGCYAHADPELCVGCGQCAKACPASVIKIMPRETPKKDSI